MGPDKGIVVKQDVRFVIWLLWVISTCMYYYMIWLSCLIITAFLLDNVVGNGTESNLHECKHNPWNTENCRNTEHVYVACSKGEFRCWWPQRIYILSSIDFSLLIKLQTHSHSGFNYKLYAYVISFCLHCLDLVIYK